jgi:hypothetical protein
MARILIPPANIREENCKTKELQQKDVDGLIFFGLTPIELHLKVGYYFEYSRYSTLNSLVDLLEEIQEESKDGGDYLSSFINQSKGLAIIASLDCIEPHYRLFAQYFGEATDYHKSPVDSNPDESAIKSARVLHREFLNLVSKVDKVGFSNFVDFITNPIYGTALPDIIAAFGCIINLYVFYKRAQNQLIS